MYPFRRFLADSFGSFPFIWRLSDAFHFLSYDVSVSDK